MTSCTIEPALQPGLFYLGNIQSNTKIRMKTATWFLALFRRTRYGPFLGLHLMIYSCSYFKGKENLSVMFYWTRKVRQVNVFTTRRESCRICLRTLASEVTCSHFPWSCHDLFFLTLSMFSERNSQGNFKNKWVRMDEGWSSPRGKGTPMGSLSVVSHPLGLFLHSVCLYWSLCLAIQNPVCLFLF